MKQHTKRPTTIYHFNPQFAQINWGNTTQDSADDNVWSTAPMNYLLGKERPRYPLPAIRQHLDLIAAEPMLCWEDFKAIGFHGSPRRCCYN